LNIRGARLMASQRFDEAAGLFQQAEQKTREERGLHAAILQNLGSCYNRLGEFDRATASLQAAVDQHEQAGAVLYLERALGEMGNSHYLRGNPNEARPYYERALKLAHQLNESRDASKWAGNLAAAYTELRDWDSAERINAEAAGLKKEIRSNTLYTTL